MSKKILKRSLALGALMAFVITGSVFAESYSGSFGNLDGTGDRTITDKDASATIRGTGSITGYDNLTIESTYGNAVGSPSLDDGKISISAGNVTLKADKAVANSNPNGNAILANNNMDITANGDLTLLANNRIIRATNGTTTLNATNIYMNANEDGTVTNSIKDDAAIKVDGGSKLNIDADKLVLNAVRDSGSLKAILLKGSNTSVDIKGNANIKAESKNSWGVGVYADEKAVFKLTGDEVSVTAVTKKDAYGVFAKNGASVILGSDATQNIDVNLEVGASNDPSVGIYSWTASGGEKSSLEVNGKALNVGITTSNDIGDSDVYGILIQNVGGYVANSVMPKIDIDDATSTNIVIKDKNGTAVGIAISAMGGSVVDIKGNAYISAKKAILTRGQSTINIGGKDKNVEIYGDIDFGYADNSGTTIDADVNIDLDTANSVFEGRIYKSLNGLDPNDEKAKVTGMNIELSGGATWKVTGESIVNKATFGADAIINLGDGELYNNANENAVYALKAGDLNEAKNNNILTVDSTAKLQIDNIKETTYNIATGFENYDKVAESIDIVDNALLQANKFVNKENKTYQVKIEAKKADQMAADTGISESTAGLVESIIKGASKADKTDAEQAAVDFINNVMKENGSDNAAVGNAINAATKMGEAGGNSATAASIVKNVTGVTNDRLSFNCGHSAPHKGGHGVGLFEEGSGADVWVEYVHGKDEVEDMPSTAGASSYEGQYNGIVMGVDFKKVNKFQSGIAFNYGEGDTNSVGNAVRTHSDYDFWGVGYYGSIHNDDSNVIFDISYAQTDSDVTQNNSGTAFEANPETTTWSAGVKLEKLYQNENVQIVPYTGLRYMSIDADDYSTRNGEFYYSMDRQDIWLLPLGVSIKQEVTNDNGWTVSPRVDLSYIWAFGDTNSNMEVKSPFAGVSQLGYDVMDDGSFLGLVGIEAHKGQWGYGIAYSYQKGDHSESKKWFVDVNYSF